VFFRFTRRRSCWAFSLLAPNKCRARPGRPDQQGRRGQPDPKEHQAPKVRRGLPVLLVHRENQAKPAPLARLVRKERSDRRADEGKPALRVLVVKRVRQARWALPVHRGNKDLQVKRVKQDQRDRLGLRGPKDLPVLQDQLVPLDRPEQAAIRRIKRLPLILHKFRRRRLSSETRRSRTTRPLRQ
jgi:hypothetical protein